MNSFFSKMKTDLLWSYSSLVVLAVSGILLNFIIAFGYNAETLGMFNQCFAIYIIASQFSVGGIHFAVLKDVSVLQNQSAQTHSTLSGIVGGLFLSIIVATLLFNFAEIFAFLMKSPRLETGVKFIAVAIIFFGQNKIIFSALNGIRAIRSLSILQAFRYLLIIGTVIWIWVSKFNPDFLMAVFAVAEIILWLVSFSCFLFLRGFVRPSVKTVKKHLKFGLSACFSGVLVELNTRVDILVLGFFMGDKTVGIYSFGAMIAEGFYGLLVVVRTNLNPLIARHLAISDREALTLLIRRTQMILYPTLAIALVLILAIYEPVVKAIFGQSDFLQAEIILLILLVGIWFNCGMFPFEWSLSQGGYPGWQTFLALTVVFSNLIFNFLLIPSWGMIGAAIATVGSMLVALLCCSYLTKKILGIDVVFGRYN